MSERTLIVNEVTRTPSGGPEDHLDLSEGVNVLIGAPNTGKSKWLQMIDFVLGNDDDAASVFGEDVAGKYNSIAAKLTVAGEEWEVERRWNDGTPKTRVFLNGESLNSRQYWHRILEQLQIPILHYPQGNPYGQRTWPELGWRSLIRHMYRRQRYWSDIADRQPESEQHACVLQFVGLAEHLFSEQYGDLVKKEKRIIELKAQKEQFMSVLSELSKDILSADEIGVGVTPQSLNSAKQRIESQINDLAQERNQILSALSANLARDSVNDGNTSLQLSELSNESAVLENRLDELRVARERTNARMYEVTEYRTSIQQEVERLHRARKAGTTLADLKVTHCPVCDRPVANTHSGDDCYLCHRPFDTSNATGSLDRLEMEIQQAEAVLAESEEMLGVLTQERQELDSEINTCQARNSEIRGLLRPVRTAAAAVLPPEIGVLDMKAGRLQEQLAQVERIVNSLAHRETLTEMIEKIQSESVDLENEVAERNAKLDFERASDAIEDGMNTYLNALTQAKPKSWTQKSVRVRIDEKRTRFLIGDQKKWSAQLGGTLTLYFLLSYHYALMNLLTYEGNHFPGFLAIDFPAELPDGSSIKDAENFVIEPFVKLLAIDDFPKGQAVIAGNAFEGLEGTNRIEFTKVWT